MWDAGRRTPDAGKSKNNMSTPQWGGHNDISVLKETREAIFKSKICANKITLVVCVKESIAQISSHDNASIFTFL